MTRSFPKNTLPQRGDRQMLPRIYGKIQSTLKLAANVEEKQDDSCELDEMRTDPDDYRVCRNVKANEILLFMLFSILLLTLISLYDSL